MNTENNVISLNHSVNARVEQAIVTVLENRCGRWVGQHMLEDAAERVALPNTHISQVINHMVEVRKLERSFQTVMGKFGRNVELPLYRLPPLYS